MFAPTLISFHRNISGLPSSFVSWLTFLRQLLLSILVLHALFTLFASRLLTFWNWLHINGVSQVKDTRRSELLALHGIELLSVCAVGTAVRTLAYESYTRTWSFSTSESVSLRSLEVSTKNLFSASKRQDKGHILQVPPSSESKGPCCAWWLKSRNDLWGFSKTEACQAKFGLFEASLMIVRIVRGK
jgi:hypothetical protein